MTGLARAVYGSYGSYGSAGGFFRRFVGRFVRRGSINDGIQFSSGSQVRWGPMETEAWWLSVGLWVTIETVCPSMIRTPEVSLKCKSECECDKVGEVITGYWCLLMCVWVWVILPQHHNTIPLFHHQCYCGNCGVVSWNSAYLPLPSKTTLPAMADTSNNACTWQLHI